MEEPNLNASPRDTLGKKVKKLRLENQIPAILYGSNFKNLPLLLDKKEFEKLYLQAGSSTLINLNVKNQDSIKILIHEVQKSPVSDEIIHVDLFKVDMKQEIHTNIALKFVGSSAAVQDLEGNLITNKDSLEVECLPDKLVSEIEVDISPLKTFEDLIRVKDINIPEGIKVLDEKEEIVAQVTPPRSEEELKEMEEEAASEAEKAQVEKIEEEAQSEKIHTQKEAEEKTEGIEETPVTEEQSNQSQEKSTEQNKE